MKRIVLHILVIILTVISLLLLAISITMFVDFGHPMTMEGQGYFSTAALLAIIFGIPTIVLWLIIYRQPKKGKTIEKELKHNEPK